MAPGLQREIDPIERAAAPEHLLRCVDVHDREIAAEGLVNPVDFMMPRIVNCLFAFGGARAESAPEPNAVACRRTPSTPSASRAARGKQRVVDHRLFSSFQVVVAKAAVAGHVDTEHQQVALRRQCSVSTTASITGTATRTSDADWTFSRMSSSKPASPALTCSSVLPAIGRRSGERDEHALIGGVHADEHGDAEHDAGRRQHDPEHVLPEVRPADQSEQNHQDAAMRTSLDESWPIAV